MSAKEIQVSTKIMNPLLWGLLLCLSSPVKLEAASLLINGAGATFPYPLYSKWFSEYQTLDPSVQINYQSIGSGGGIRQFIEKTVDFGATDAPMSDEQLAKSPVPIVHIPTVLGAVTLTYNLPEVDKNLVFDPETLAGIFLGKITQWNDPRLQTVNPNVKLSDEAIIVVHRSDGSGTSNIFTDYLSKVSPEWKSKVGAGTAVNWPTGLGGKGNEGVSGVIKQTPGSIGYVELIYAKSNSLPVAKLKNKAGNVIEPTVKSVTAAADGSIKKIPPDFRVSITDPEGKDSYPVSGFTYLLVYQTLSGPKAPKIVNFLKWAIRDGQKFAEPLHYAPLPKGLAKKVEAKIKSIGIK